MQAVVTINLDNAAFSDEAGTELARIFRELADRLEYAGTIPHMAIRDVNGNTVGDLETYK